MAFLPKPGEKIEEAESVSDRYELTGSDDDRLRQAYKVKKNFLGLRWVFIFGAEKCKSSTCF